MSLEEDIIVALWQLKSKLKESTQVASEASRSQNCEHEMMSEANLRSPASVIKSVHQQ